jgi:hypothetical protein
MFRRVFRKAVALAIVSSAALVGGVGLAAGVPPKTWLVDALRRCV